jgi:autotransporter-associated beta strand protein
VNNAGPITLLYVGGTLIGGTLLPTVSLGALSGAGVIDNTNASASALSLGVAATTANGVFSGTIRNSGAGVLTVVRNATSGTLFITGLNTYTGPTILSGNGTLSVTTLADGGVASGIGMSSNAASNLVFNGGTLQYTGANTSFAQFTQTPSVSTNRLFTLAGNATIDSSGNYGNHALATGVANNAALVFSNTGALAFAGTGARTLTLTGSSTGDNEIKLQLLDNGTGALSVTKTGAGLWLLSGSNTFTGATSVTGGILQALDGTGLPTNSNLTLNGGVFQTSGTFTRTPGVAAGQVQFPGSGGFAASGTGLKVHDGNRPVCDFHFNPELHHRNGGCGFPDPD